MDVSLHIPDEVAQRLGGSLAEVERAFFEALVADLYRTGRFDIADLTSLLKLDGRHEVDGFLKRHAIYDDYGVADLQRERASLDALGV